MSHDPPTNFYHMMFGLPADVSAPDYYELLGVEQFEDDVERIRTAAIDRNRQLLSWQNSQFHADADQLMDEIVSARAILSDPEEKAAYDRQLSGQAPPAPRELVPEEAAPRAMLSPFSAAEARAAQRAWARALGKTTPRARNTVGLSFMLIPPGTFMMGSPASDSEARDDEQPQVMVTLTQPLYVGRTAVTQGQWQSVMNTTPWRGRPFFKDEANSPATCVSWDDAQVFCQRLAANDGKKYRLLTEAEWEYACRAGTTTKYHFGESASTLGTYAWFADNTSKVGEQYAHVVGQKQANPFGLYDMHGNVLEWCADWYAAPLAGGSDPAGPSYGSLRVGRGGSWFFTAGVCRSARRIGVSPSIGQASLGFRVAAGTSGT